MFDYLHLQTCKQCLGQVAYFITVHWCTALLLVTDAQAGEVVLDTVAEHPQVVAVRPVLVQQRQQGPVHLDPEPAHSGE